MSALPIAACTSAQESPDPLLALADAAHTDAEQARAIFAKYPELTGAKVIASARAEQAKALRKEVVREAGESSAAKRRAAKPEVPGDSGSAGQRLTQALRTAQRNAADLVPTLPRYRAGLVGSVSAGCATLLEALS